MSKGPGRGIFFPEDYKDSPSTMERLKRVSGEGGGNMNQNDNKLQPQSPWDGQAQTQDLT